MSEVRDPVQATLLRASTMLYLFRTLTAAESEEQQRSVELHIVRLVNEVSNTDGGFVLLVAPGRTLEDAVREREFPELAIAVDRACKDGIVHVEGITAAPLYVHDDVFAGAIYRDCELGEFAFTDGVFEGSAGRDQ